MWQSIVSAVQGFILAALGYMKGLADARNEQKTAVAESRVEQLRTSQKSTEDVRALSDEQLDDELRNPPPRAKRSNR